MDGLADKTAYSAKLLVKYSSKWATKSDNSLVYMCTLCYTTQGVNITLEKVEKLFVHAFMYMMSCLNSD